MVGIVNGGQPQLLCSEMLPCLCCDHASHGYSLLMMVNGRGIKTGLFLEQMGDRLKNSSVVLLNVLRTVLQCQALSPNLLTCLPSFKRLIIPA